MQHDYKSLDSGLRDQIFGVQRFSKSINVIILKMPTLFNLFFPYFYAFDLWGELKDKIIEQNHTVQD